jgi:hypothetical protein
VTATGRGIAGKGAETGTGIIGRGDGSETNVTTRAPPHADAGDARIVTRHVNAIPVVTETGTETEVRDGTTPALLAATTGMRTGGSDANMIGIVTGRIRGRPGATRDMIAIEVARETEKGAAAGGGVIAGRNPAARTILKLQ